MKTPIITGIVTAENAKAIFNKPSSEIETQLSRCGALEFRADTFELESFTRAFSNFQSLVKRLRKNQPGLLKILTVRLPRDGGLWTGSVQRRTRWLEDIIQPDQVDMVDIEVEHVQTISDRIWEKLKKINSGLLISHHQFTPGYREDDFQCILRQMEQTEVGGYKFAISLDSLTDLLSFLTFSAKLANKSEITSMVGMGKLGAVSRVAAVILGCPLTYAFLGESPTVPGQLNTAKLKQVLDNFNTRYNSRMSHEKMIRLIEALINE